MSFDEDRAEFNRLWPFVQQFQALAIRHGIDDVFQDNGGKLLQALLALRLKKLPGREGHDAEDFHGRQYELKSVNVSKVSGVTTHHHMTRDIIQGYREVDWVIAMYDGIEVVEVWRLGTKQMEHWYCEWTAKLERTGKDHLNNPKVPITYVRKHGEVIFKPSAGGKGLLL